MLLVTALMATICFVPLASYSADGADYALHAFDVVWVGGLFALSALLSFVIVWCFKNRLLQIRLGAANIVLIVGSQAFALFYAIRMSNSAAALGMTVLSTISTPAFFPLVCIILQWLSLRATYKDEKLVRSLDRIR